MNYDSISYIVGYYIGRIYINYIDNFVINYKFSYMIICFLLCNCLGKYIEVGFWCNECFRMGMVCVFNVCYYFVKGNDMVDC